MYGKSPIKWQDRANSVAAYHISKLKENPNWRVQDTADYLQRSKGRISEDLKLASWMKIHPKVATFETAYEALEFVKRQERDRRLNRGITHA